MCALQKSHALCFILLFIPVAAISYTGVPDGSIQPAAHDEDFEWELVQLTNEFREDLGLPPFKLNDDLTFSCRYHCIDMIEDGYYFHDTYDSGNVWVCSFAQRIRAYYPEANFLIDIIASGFPTPQSVLDAWIASPPHYDFLIMGNREFGTGFADMWGLRMWDMAMTTSNDIFPIVINREARETDSLDVDLYLYGEGVFSEMRLRNDDGDWAAWQPFQAEIPWVISPGNGERTVYAEFSDGETTSESSDRIIVTSSASPAPPAPGGLIFSAHPNPFNPSTTIYLTLPEPGPVNLAVYDVSGRLVNTLLECDIGTNVTAVTWSGTDQEGSTLASGIYLLRLVTDLGIKTQKVSLTK